MRMACLAAAAHRGACVGRTCDAPARNSILDARAEGKALDGPSAARGMTTNDYALASLPSLINLRSEIPGARLFSPPSGVNVEHFGRAKRARSQVDQVSSLPCTPGVQAPATLCFLLIDLTVGLTHLATASPRCCAYRAGKRALQTSTRKNDSRGRCDPLLLCVRTCHAPAERHRTCGPRRRVRIQPCDGNGL